MRILTECNEKENTTVIMVAHDPDFAKMTRRQVQLADGRVIRDEFNTKENNL